ncbi:hypothetical protein D3C72_1530190 [compost metagenome]
MKQAFQCLNVEQQAARFFEQQLTVAGQLHPASGAVKQAGTHFVFQLLYRRRNRGFWHQQDLRSADKTAHLSNLDKNP